ncbi:MAG: glycosyltransferase family 4 protein [Candidatus Stahlbacteria bacterium]|nr:glycosyltransferase family 4 protein [Candidatus Stahlbacteria bacterium]
MKIAYISPGESIHDHRFFDKFIEKGHRVYVISYYWPRDIAFRWTGIKFLHYNSWNNKWRTHRFGSMRKYLDIGLRTAYLRNQLNKIKPDILHCGWVQTDGLYGALSGFHPFLLMPWGSDIMVNPDRSFYEWKVARFAIRKADMITCDCEYVKDKIVEISGYPADKIITFPWGIDLKKFNPNIDRTEIRNKLGWQDKKIILMNRSFKHIYDHMTFIKGLPDLLKEDKDIRIMFIGEGELLSDMKSLVKDKEQRVKFLARVENAEMPKYLRAADIYVSTSLSDGSSLSLMEAFACGLPCVVTDVPAIREWVVNGINGFIVPRKNTQGVVEKILMILRDEKLRKEIRNNNWKVAQERADWDKNFQVLEKIYDRLIRTTKRRKDGYPQQ